MVLWNSPSSSVGQQFILFWLYFVFKEYLSSDADLTVVLVVSLQWLIRKEIVDYPFFFFFFARTILSISLAGEEQDSRTDMGSASDILPVSQSQVSLCASLHWLSLILFPQESRPLDHHALQ